MKLRIDFFNVVNPALEEKVLKRVRFAAGTFDVGHCHTLVSCSPHVFSKMTDTCTIIIMARS